MATSTQVQRIAAFSDGNAGGNPAGVLISDSLPDAAEMQRIAADIGFSETAFAAPQDGGWPSRWARRWRCKRATAFFRWH